MDKENLKSYGDILHNLATKDQLRSLKKEDNSRINLSSNDYLGVAKDINLRQKFSKLRSNEFIYGSTSSRLLSGNYNLLEEFEDDLSKAYGNNKEALLLNSGYHANSGIIPALTDRHDLILADQLNHASIFDGSQLSRADFLRYRHLDYQHLEELLHKKAHKYQRVLIISESVFSMDGDIADIKKLVQIKTGFPNVILYIDEAHAVGVRGAQGLGVCEEQDVISEIEVIVGTFGKAYASMGAYAILDNPLRSYLINSCRTLIYSTALPPINTLFSKFIFEQLCTPQFGNKREELQELANWFRMQLKQAGINCGEHQDTSNIIPIIIGSNERTLKLAKRLKEGGFICPAIRPPTVPEGSSRLRLSLTADTEKDDLLRLIQLITLS